MQGILGIFTALRPLIDPFRPALFRVLLLLMGVIIGISSVYLGMPGVGIRWRSAEPVHLADGWKDTWVKNTALIYSSTASGATGETLDTLNAQTRSDLEAAGYGPEQIEELAEQNPPLQNVLLNVRDLPSQAEADDARGKISGNIFTTLGPVLYLFVLGLVMVVAGIVLSFRPPPIGKWKRNIVRDERTGAMAEQERQRRQAIEAARKSSDAPDASTANLGTPVTRQMSAYVLGDDLFSDSFAIEPNGGFAGEMGVELSESIGEGAPKKPAAFEVFVFDQADIQTLTYLIVSEYAYQDDALRAKLAPRGEEMIVAQPGKSFMMETKNLVMQVRIVDVAYGEGSLPPNSFFEKLTLSLAVWLKEGVEVAVWA
ncbi:MAG: hypothetical protein HC915_08570, partial [Anaerolineae bacterium]|nr:hypothetical protein [Anaerolineae bacterium]